MLLDRPGYVDLKEQLDAVIFLDIPWEQSREVSKMTLLLILQRVVARKVKGGRSKESAEAHFDKVDKPNILEIQSKKFLVRC